MGLAEPIKPMRVMPLLIYELRPYTMEISFCLGIHDKKFFSHRQQDTNHLFQFENLLNPPTILKKVIFQKLQLMYKRTPIGFHILI